MGKKVKSPPSKKTRKALSRAKLVLLFSIGTLLVLSSIHLLISFRIVSHDQGFEDVLLLLRERGYEINHGFSGTCSPGNIIQVSEHLDGKTVALREPILVCSAETCFPDKKPLRSHYALPEYSGLSASGISTFAITGLPILTNLSQYGDTVADFSLEFGDTQLLTFPKLDLSRKLSDQCLQSIDNALADGDRLEWYKVITQAVLADYIRYKIHWRSGASVEVRQKIKQKATQELGSVVRVDTEKKMVLEQHGRLILAYKFRHLIRKEGSKRLGVIGWEKQKNVSSKETAGNADKSKITVRLVQGDRSRLVRFDHPFAKRDHFRFQIIPGRTGDLYIFHYKPTRDLDQIWPRQETIETAKQGFRVEKGLPVEIPPAEAAFRFNEMLDEERFYIVIAEPQNQVDVRQKLEQYAIRSRDQDNDEYHKLGYVSGLTIEDPYLYFSELLEETQIEVVAFRLGGRPEDGIGNP